MILCIALVDVMISYLDITIPKEPISVMIGEPKQPLDFSNTADDDN